MKDELCEARILIVEDIEVQLQGNKRDLETISSETLSELGIGSFIFHMARSVGEAEGFLADAAASPYHLVLLDLGIPVTTGERENIQNGRMLLDKIRKEGLAKEIIIISIWYVIEEVARAYRNGVFDFIAKPFETHELQARFIRCWKQLLAKESTRLLGEERTDELVQYAEKGLAHRFTVCFSGMVQSVVHNIEEVEQYIHERYDLDRRKDSQDPLFRLLKLQQEDIAKKQAEWAQLKNSLISPNDELRAESVESLFAEIRRSVLSCLIVKNFELNLQGEKQSEISTFADDVSAVVKEIIVGALRAAPDYYDQKQSIQINVENRNAQVKMVFADQLEPIDGQDATVINHGTSIPPNRRFDRAWGLSVVQHVAMRGGGRLEITPQPNGNLVTYYVPSAK